MKNNIFKIKLILCVVAAAFGLAACEKVIDLDIKDNTNALVIEGNIVEGANTHYISLSQSLALDQNSTFPAVADATVVVSTDAGATDTLNYIGEGKYQTHTITGEAGRTYLLTVLHQGKQYTASSTMPSSIVPLDSLKSIAFEFGGETAIGVVPIYTDPMASGNNYRFITSVNGQRDTGYEQWNDDVNNGVINGRPLILNDRDLDIKSGDNVTVEMQCVNKDTYTYFYTLSEIEGNGPGGGTTPANPPNNIIGGALGLFSAHSSQTQTITIP